MAWNTTTDPTRFHEAADWFLARIAITKGWYEGLALKWRRYTFTAANLATLEMVVQLQQSLLDAMNDGTHLREWKQAYLATLEAQWAGSVGRPGFRASTIWRNAMQRSFNTGRWQVHTDPAVLAVRPYWMFDAIIDGRETDICRERDGKIVAATDPWWNANYPPLHHRCRSRVRALRASQAEQRGITTNPVFETTRQRGFGDAPHLDEWLPEPPDMPGKLRQVWEKKMAGLTPVQPPLSPPPPPPGAAYNPATTPAPAPAVKPRPVRRPKPSLEAATEPAAPPPLRDTILGELVEGPKGSNPGGLYRGTDGILRYVKEYDDRAQAYGEHLANQIYEALGLGSPESVVFELADGRYGYASTIIPNARTLADAGLTAARAKATLRGFAADVLTANWDAAGLQLDNLLILKGGKIIRIDNGGTFLMRARAGRKATNLLDQITEWTGFLNPQRNPAYARLAAEAGITDARQLGAGLIRQIDAILKLEKDAGGWDAFVRLHAPGLMPDDHKAIVRMLTARTAELKAQRREIRAFMRATKAAQRAAAQPSLGAGPTLDITADFGKGLNVTDRGRNPATRMASAARAVDPNTFDELSFQISSWTGGFSKSHAQREMRQQARMILAGKAPTNRVGELMQRALNARAGRWQAAAQAQGIPVPGAFRVYRGVKDHDGRFLQDVYEAWKAGADTMMVRSHEMASWSLHRQTAVSFASGGGQSVVFQADLPFAQTFADQLVEDGTFISQFFGEHEVISLTARPNMIEGSARGASVRFNGRIYTWDQRADFIRDWEAAHGPNGKVAP